jgi:hypothetical protein
MKCLAALPLLLFLCSGQRLMAQEASQGVDISATVTMESVASNELSDQPRSGSPIILATRSVVYPTIKLSENWFVTGAVQFATRPYFYQDLSSAGYGAKGNVLQAAIDYSRVSNRGSLVLHAGEMPTAFGGFVLRYDETNNPLVDVPPAYGYYYSPISFLGVAGAQVDGSRGKFDGRVQFANSSPANPRSLFAKDQYGNWAGGAGYTVRQGFRIGVSGYRGPYLDRQYAYFLPGEANPSKLPAHGLGIDANWSHRHSWAYVELQKFVMPYTLFPNFRESTAYGELRQDISPRWFIAARYGYSCNSVSAKQHSIETGMAFRPNRYQLIKIAYEEQRYQGSDDTPNHTLGIQYVLSLHRTLLSH